MSKSHALRRLIKGRKLVVSRSQLLCVTVRTNGQGGEHQARWVGADFGTSESIPFTSCRYITYKPYVIYGVINHVIICYELWHLGAWGKAGFRLEKMLVMVVYHTPLKNMLKSVGMTGGSDTFPTTWQCENHHWWCSDVTMIAGWWF